MYIARTMHRNRPTGDERWASLRAAAALQTEMTQKTTKLKFRCSFLVYLAASNIDVSSIDSAAGAAVAPAVADKDANGSSSEN